MSIRGLGKQSLVYGLGHMLARLITFLLLPLYTHSNGLPFAMQLLGKKFDEKSLLSFSSEIILNS